MTKLNEFQNHLSICITYDRSCVIFFHCYGDVKKMYEKGHKLNLLQGYIQKFDLMSSKYVRLYFGTHAELNFSFGNS